MMVDVIEVRPLGGYRLYLKFEDGVEGEVDVGPVGWPNGADLDPDALYAKVSGKPIAI